MLKESAIQISSLLQEDLQCLNCVEQILNSMVIFGKIIENESEVAEILNDFFITKIKDLKSTDERRPDSKIGEKTCK